MAQAVYDTYVALRDHDGWWHSNQGPGDFSPHDMLEWLLRAEFSGVANQIPSEKQNEIVVRNFYAICVYRGSWCDSKSDTDVIEYIAAKKLADQKGRHFLVPRDSDPTGIWIEGPHWGSTDFSTGFKNPGVWISGVGDLTVPYDWGNLEMLTIRFPENPERYDEAFEAKGGNWDQGGQFIAQNEFYYKLPPNGDRNAFIVLNRRQTLYWYRSID